MGASKGYMYGVLTAGLYGHGFEALVRTGVA